MDIRYLIGIHFGAEETTASYIDLEDPSRPKPLHIRYGCNADEDMVETCICKDEDTGEWRFVRGIKDYKSPDFRIGFTQPMNEITAENKEAFSEFVKLVFFQILKYQNFLRYDPCTGSRNFYLWVSCPSVWNNNQKHEYENFLRFLIPVEGVIRESDAIYYKYITKDFHERSVLIIDVESTSIDFSYFDPFTGTVHNPKGFPHGINRMVESIIDYLEEYDETFQEGKKRILSVLGEEKTKTTGWIKNVQHYVKTQLDDFYIRELNFLDLNLRLRLLVASLRSGILFDCEIDKETLENIILKDYKNQLRKDFETAANWLAPQIVIMTGKGIRMPWVLHLAKEVFTKDDPKVRVYTDSNPTYSISYGLVTYAFSKKDNQTEAIHRRAQEQISEYEYAIKHPPFT